LIFQNLIKKYLINYYGTTLRVGSFVTSLRFGLDIHICRDWSVPRPSLPPLVHIVQLVRIKMYKSVYINAANIVRN